MTDEKVEACTHKIVLTCFEKAGDSLDALNKAVRSVQKGDIDHIEVEVL